MQQDLFYPLEFRETPEKVKYIQNFELPTIDYKTQKHVSFSQMNVFRGCEYRWKLEYKDGLRKFTSSSHTTFGTAMHETLQSYLDVLYNESEQKADDLDLNTIFKNNFMKEYEKQVKDNDDNHYMSQDEFVEFFEDGIHIIANFKSDRQKHFYKDKIHLVGCEVPITLPPDPNNKNVVYIGYLDVVIYNERTGRFKIIDIKTSTKGWFKWAKEDETKQFQLLLYKKYFSIQYNIPEDKIDIEFFILKRKLWENSKYPQNHIQLFEPVSGPIKINKAVKAMSSFINECFNSDGSFKEREFQKNPSKKSCMFCPYKDDQKLCGLGSKF
jgi:hypothetical protein